MMKLVYVILICSLVWYAVAQPNSPRRAKAQAIELPEPEAKIYVKGKYRYIEGNGVPDHDHAEFPRRGNPHAILPQHYEFRVLAEPKVAAKLTYLERGPFGVALNGVPFDPGTAEYWKNDRRSGWRYEALSGFINLGLDHNNAHVQPTGAYHYHGLPVGLINARNEDGEMTLVGYAADGFPVYSQFGYEDPKDLGSKLIRLQPSYKLKEGWRPDGTRGPGGSYDGTFVQDYEYKEEAGDLDECNGRFGVTKEYPEGTYYYCITETFPFIPRVLKGDPDPSFARGRGTGQGRTGRAVSRRERQ